MLKIKFTYSVKTFDVDYREVTNELGIVPSRCYNKGDDNIGKCTGKNYPYLWGLWEIEAPIQTNDNCKISNGIKYFKELLNDKFKIITKLKNDYNFECIFYIDIETDMPGAGIDLEEDDMFFIAKISTRYSCHITYTANNTILSKDKLNRI